MIAVRSRVFDVFLSFVTNSILAISSLTRSRLLVGSISVFLVLILLLKIDMLKPRYKLGCRILPSGLGRNESSSMRTTETKRCMSSGARSISPTVRSKWRKSLTRYQSWLCTIPADSIDAPFPWTIMITRPTKRSVKNKDAGHGLARKLAVNIMDLPPTSRLIESVENVIMNYLSDLIRIAVDVDQQCY
jgi:hypothetical protein